MDKNEIKKFHNAYINEDETELDRLWKQVAPKSLVKFFPASYLSDGDNYSLKCINDKTLWLSSPKRFNDPLDCVMNIDYYKEGRDLSYKFLASVIGAVQAEKIINSDYTKTALLETEKSMRLNFLQLRNKMEQSVYASCFSENENIYSLTMWSHYANNHTGFCAEYDFATVNNAVEFGCIPILYTNDYSYNMHSTSVNENVKNILFFVFTKALEWQSEREWRVAQINYNLCCDGYNINFSSPKQIYLGCRASDRLKNDIVKICETSNIPLFQMKLKPGTFTLIEERII